MVLGVMDTSARSENHENEEFGDFGKVKGNSYKSHMQFFYGNLGPHFYGQLHKKMASQTPQIPSPIFSWIVLKFLKDPRRASCLETHGGEL